MKTYKIGDLKRIIKESTDKNEFKPVKYNDDNKKINDKAYKDMETVSKKYDGGITSKKKMEFPKDDNRGMESLRVENPNKEYSDRIKSQLKGFTSKQDEDNHKNEPLGNGYRSNDEIVKQMKEKGDLNSQAHTKAVELGLTGSRLNKQEIENQYKSLYNENKMKKLNFKNTVFLNENHMLTRIPDMYMVEGNKFVMRDKNANEYIVEWHSDKPKVTRHFTKENILAEHDKMMRLSNYKSSDKNKISTVNTRLNENKQVNDMLSKVRKLMK